MNEPEQRLTITIQQTEHFAVLGVPREHLEALAEEIAQETFEQPPFNALVLVHKWGHWDIRMIVRNLGSGAFHIIFAIPEDVKKSLED